MAVYLKIICLLVFYSHFSFVAKPQSKDDSLRAIIKLDKQNNSQVNALIELSQSSALPFDSAQYFAQQALGLAEKLNYKKGMADSYLALTSIYSNIPGSIQSFQFAQKAMNLYKDLGDKKGQLDANREITLSYYRSGQFDMAKKAVLSILPILKDTVIPIPDFGEIDYALTVYVELGNLYLKNNQPDSALIYSEKAVAQNKMKGDALWNYPVYVLASVFSRTGKYQQALSLYRTAFSLALANGISHDTLQILSGMGDLFLRMNQPDSAIFYSQKVNLSTDPEREVAPWLIAIETLKQSYKSIRSYDSALKYTELNAKLNDSIYSKDKALYLQNLISAERLNQQELNATQERIRSRTRTYALIAGLAVFLIIAFLLWRSNRRKQIAKAKIEKAYSELEATQSQLVHAEKMASLGELTAGIAHEIQNPLNFINNFSEVNKELTDEMEDELNEGKIKEAMQILSDLKENENKISQHGKRADGIVKAMLQHTRTSSGKKEPTDINTLCAEYLRLAFHGMRARDNSFNVKYETNFDESIGKINMVQQEFSRVLLNLINNAFYATNEKSKENIPGFEPAITVSTKKSNGKVEIGVKDNGNGIPESIREKIYQPFFTTKPTGQGTGLGLSLSYDIIKAHGGEIKVETMEGVGTEFIIQLPI